jgi:monofunctional biosynthetic peptidoglycan transglycosylase
MRISLRRDRRSGRRSRPIRVLFFAVKALALLVLASILSVVLLRWVPPVTTAVMVERRLSAWWEGRPYQTRYQWVRWDRISPHAGVAVVAAEDQRFAEHHGFDVEAIQDALDEHEHGQRLRGASTISQQVVKNVFLWSSRSFVRKGLEAYVTVLVEATWPKRRILEVYLNVVELGDGIFGVEAASQRFFRKPAARLSPGEAALLAAVLPNPHRLHADRPSAYVEERRAWILQQMDQIGGVGYLKRFEN